jgi:protein-tyrosine-phosphatase
MAEYLFRDRLDEELEWDSVSSGTIAGGGSLASGHGVSVLEEWGIDLTPHRSRPLTLELVQEASVIVVMTSGHSAELESLFGDVVRDKVFLLREFHPDYTGGDLADPIGLPADIYRHTRDEIDACMPGLIEFVKGLA